MTDWEHIKRMRWALGQIFSAFLLLALVTTHARYWTTVAVSLFMLFCAIMNGVTSKIW